MAEQVPAHIAHPCKDYPTSYNYFSTFREEPGLSVGDAYSGGQAAFGVHPTRSFFHVISSSHLFIAGRDSIPSGGIRM